MKEVNPTAIEVVGADVVVEVVEVVVGNVVGESEVDLGSSGFWVVVVVVVAVVVVGEEVEWSSGFTVVGGPGSTACLCN